MNVVPLMWIVWAGLTTALVIMLLYRNSLTRNEDDTLSLEPSGGSGHLHQQEVLLAKVQKIQPAVRVATVATVIMTVGIAGFYLWDLVKRIIV